MEPADRLQEALSALRGAALRGDLAAFDGLAGQLADLVAAVEAEMPAEEVLIRLRDAARETAALLEASGRGLGAARRRLSELETLRKGLGTYGVDGQRRRLRSGPATERRF